jgi:cyclohexanone monooxygenase
MLHRLRSLGFSVRVFEAGSGVGGTWFWNRYPGARCDVESMEYSYQFCDELQQEWDWTERYASQPEILRYIEHVADRFDLRRDIQLETRIAKATFDETRSRWVLETEDGGLYAGTYCIMATGCLSAPIYPDIPGRESFGGVSVHTAQWSHEGVDVAGKRVGVIGTGSSAIQLVPVVAREAERLFVFQRTPAYSVPAQNHPLDAETQRQVKAQYAEYRLRAKRNRAGILYVLGEKSAFDVSPAERKREYEERWKTGGIAFTAAFRDLYDTVEANDTAGEFVRWKIRQIVKDPQVAEMLSPHTVIGCKRLCVDTDYYATYNRPNVTLVDIRQTPIERIVPSGPVVGGEAIELDVLVYATGFDAITGAMSRIDIRGRNGRGLRDKWAEAPKGYLGIGLADFPNLFTVNGPGSPSVLSNMVPSIEQHVEWIADCMVFARDHGYRSIEPSRDAEDAWADRVTALAEATVYTSCNSWYLGANIPGKPRIFLPYIGFPDYVAECDRIAGNGYEGFVLEKAHTSLGGDTAIGEQDVSGDVGGVL